MAPAAGALNTSVGADGELDEDVSAGFRRSPGVASSAGLELWSAMAVVELQEDNGTGTFNPEPCASNYTRTERREEGGKWCTKPLVTGESV